MKILFNPGAGTMLTNKTGVLFTSSPFPSSSSSSPPPPSRPFLF
jgi:hypothetical protein